MTAHIAGHVIEVGPYLRQRCGWCGAVLIDVDVRQAMYPTSTPVEDRTPGTWETGAIVRIDGVMSSVVEHEDGEPVPDDCCAALDPAVTT